MNQKKHGILSNEQAEYLLKLPKKVLDEQKTVDAFLFDQTFPFNKRIELVSPADEDFSFLWTIGQSTKNTMRISLHVQDIDSYIGLLRVDFNSGHRNPEIITETLPERFHSYVGKEFSNNDHHIHYHVEGYKSLAWAIPLTDDVFAAKTIDETNFNNSLIKTIGLFAKTINLETKIIINPLLI